MKCAIIKTERGKENPKPERKINMKFIAIGESLYNISDLVRVSKGTTGKIINVLIRGYERPDYIEYPTKVARDTAYKEIFEILQKVLDK